MPTERDPKTDSLLARVFGRIGRFAGEEEEATAAAELVILVPVYLVIVYAMIFFGQGMLIRQQATEAARYMAFKAPGQSMGDVAGFFDDRFDGSLLDAQRVPPEEVIVKSEDIRNALEGEAEGKHAEQIAKVLNNNDDGLLQKAGAALIWRYQASWAVFAGVTGTNDIRAELSLYHMVPGKRRPIWEEGKDHPIMAYQLGAGQFEGEKYEKQLPEDLRDPKGKGPWDIGWRPEKGAAGEAHYEKYRGRSDESGVHPLGF